MKRLRLPRALGPALLVWLWAAGAPAAERVVAIGDIHGAYDQFVGILHETGLVNKELAWTGGKTILVQTGDVLDRGPRSRDALELLMGLVDKARAQGGEVRPLLGNHETMVMIGDLRYVSPQEYQAFAAADSEKTRDREYEGYLKYRKQRSSKTKQPLPAEDRKAWMDAHPPGFFEMRQAFSPQGRYGKWLRSLDAVTQVDDTVFLHGGLAPDLKFRSLQEINQQIRRDLDTFDKAWARLVQKNVIWQYHTLEEAFAEGKLELRRRQESGGEPDAELVTLLSLGSLTFASPNGPLWYRGWAQGGEAEQTQGLEQVLHQFKVSRMVMGHTVPAAKRITPRFGGKVMLIDTGMLSSVFQGRASALEIAGGKFQSIYVGEPAQALNANGK